MALIVTDFNIMQQSHGLFVIAELLVDVENVAYVHLAFDNVKYSRDASNSINYFLFCGLYEVCFTWN